MSRSVPERMTRIAHLSDLHFGRIDGRALDSLAAAVDRLDPAAVVVTGDITQSGRSSEFAEAAAFLKSLGRLIVAVPGNHDAPVYDPVRRFTRPWSLYERHIGAVAETEATVGGVFILGVNSARRAALRFNWSYGRLRRSRISELAEAAREAAKDRLVIVALHHPFVKGPGRAGAEIVGRGGEAVPAFVEAGVGVIMTGHVHHSSVTPIDESEGRILSIQAGTATSTRTRAEPASFFIVDCEESHAVAATPYLHRENGFEAGEPHHYRRENGIWTPAP